MKKSSWGRSASTAGNTPLDEFANLKNYLDRIKASEPEPKALERIWYKVNKTIDATEETAVRRSRQWISIPRWAVAVAVLILSLLAGLNSAVASALPDSPLYPIKRTWEAAEWQITISRQDRARLALTLADLHFSEAEALVAKGAAPELIMESLKDSLAYLDAAANLGLSEEITRRLLAIQRQVRVWPPDDQVVAMKLLETWFQAHLSLIPESGEIPQPVTPTALPPILTPVPLIANPAPLPLSASPTVGEPPVTPTSLLSLITPTPQPSVVISTSVPPRPTLPPPALTLPPPVLTLPPPVPTLPPPAPTLRIP